MFKKKLVIGMLMAALSAGVLTGCGSRERAADNNAQTTEAPAAIEGLSATDNAKDAANAGDDTVVTEISEENKSTEFVMEYPAHMAEFGYTESLVLEEEPKTVVTLSTYPVLTLFAMDVKLAAAPSTKVIRYPDDFDGVILPGMMSDTFDLETIVALEPDLVIMPVSGGQQYGAALEELEIPVYYVAMTAAGTDVYTLIKEQTEALVNAFSVNTEKAALGAAVMESFAESDAALEEIKKLTKGKRVMSITVSGETSIYMNSESSTLGCMLKLCGLENVYVPVTDAAAGHSMAEMDMEKSLEYNPDIIVICGSSTLEDNKALMDSIYALNPEYWDSYAAYKEGRVIYLPSSYVSTAGINIINNISDLITELEALVK